MRPHGRGRNTVQRIHMGKKKDWGSLDIAPPILNAPVAPPSDALLTAKERDIRNAVQNLKPFTTFAAIGAEISFSRPHVSKLMQERFKHDRAAMWPMAGIGVSLAPRRNCGYGNYSTPRNTKGRCQGINPATAFDRSCVVCVRQARFLIAVTSFEIPAAFARIDSLAANAASSRNSMLFRFSCEYDLIVTRRFTCPEVPGNFLNLHTVVNPLNSRRVPEGVRSGVMSELPVQPLRVGKQAHDCVVPLVAVVADVMSLAPEPIAAVFQGVREIEQHRRNVRRNGDDATLQFTCTKSQATPCHDHCGPIQNGEIL